MSMIWLFSCIRLRVSQSTEVCRELHYIAFAKKMYVKCGDYSTTMLFRNRIYVSGFVDTCVGNRHNYVQGVGVVVSVSVGFQ